MENKKKILFVLNCMGVGGIAKSLRNLLVEIEKYNDEFEIDLFLFKKWGPHLEGLPKNVNIIEAKGNLQLFACSQKDSKQFGKWFYFKRMVVAIWSKLFTNYLPLKLFCKQNKLKTEYDASIAFAHTMNSRSMGAGSIEFVLWGTKAKKKFDFVHGDVVLEKLLGKGNVKKFKQFDKIFSVSESCKNQMVQQCPALESNADFMYNTQSCEDILEKSKKQKVELSKEINFLTVARLEKQKAHMRLLPVLKKLHDEGYKFVYNVVGDGIEREAMENFIAENNMAHYVKLFGNQNNPFPYYVAADVFLLPSYYEAAPMVINEAFLLGLPVLSTEIISAYEMIGENGWVCKNDADSIYEKIKYVLDNKDEIKQKQSKLKGFVYDNKGIVDKLFNLIKE